MTMLSKKVLIPVLCVTLGACAFKKDDDKATPEQTKLADDVVKKIQDGKDEINVQLQSDNVTVVFKDDKPEEYQMIVTWPPNVGAMDVHLDGNFIKTVLGANSINLPVRQSRKYTLHLRAFASAANGGRLLSEFESEYNSPTDIIYNHEINLTQETEVSAHRIYFNKNGHLYTNGNNLKISADQIIVTNDDEVNQGRAEDTYHIVTFRDPEIATSNTMKASYIEVKSPKAIGNLKVALTGRNGADGVDGIDKARAEGTILNAQAPAGENGANGEIVRVVERGESLGPDLPPNDIIVTNCKKPPTNGSNGTDGLPGADGTDGVNGGATGNIYVEVLDDSQFTLTAHLRPGKGGRGGKGSPGQLGGKGGAPGNTFGVCPPAKPGADGKSGTDGKNGKDGKDGQVGEIVTQVKKVYRTIVEK